MDNRDREIIDGLFGRLRQAETQTGPRDQEAESHITNLVKQQPAAPYYMAQAIVIQEQALQAAQARIQELEHEVSQRPAAGGGGFLSGLFGGGAKPAAPPPPRQPMQMPGQQAHGGNQPWGQQQPMAGNSPWGRPAGQGGGFMAGAMQTAVGVAGGVVLGNMIAGMLSSNDAQAADAPAEAEPDQMAMEEDFGGDDFGMGDDEF